MPPSDQGIVHELPKRCSGYRRLLGCHSVSIHGSADGGSTDGLMAQIDSSVGAVFVGDHVSGDVDIRAFGGR